MEKKKTMLLEFTPEEYDSIPSPKRTWVMKCIRQCKEAEAKAEFALEETEWGFKIERQHGIQNSLKTTNANTNHWENNRHGSNTQQT